MLEPRVRSWAPGLKWLGGWRRGESGAGLSSWSWGQHEGNQRRACSSQVTSLSWENTAWGLGGGSFPITQTGASAGSSVSCVGIPHHWNPVLAELPPSGHFLG